MNNFLTVKLKMHPNLWRPKTFGRACLVSLTVFSFSFCNQADHRFNVEPSADVTSLNESVDHRQISQDPWESMQNLAESLSKGPYRQGYEPIPQILSELDYEQYRSIRYRPEKSLWRGQSPFEVQLFHLGFLYKTPVKLFIFDSNTKMLEPFKFDSNLFRYDTPAPTELNEMVSAPGYAGFRIHYPLNRPGIADEIAVFLGASYFRLLGPGHAHGLSSRGLAINTATDMPEEFPVFTEFWLRKPVGDEKMLEFYALLQSPSVTGAYKFQLGVDENTVLEVTKHLYARRNISKVGIAPLTSMFLYGPDQAPQFDDYRPSVHDSEGLLLAINDNHWEWRPLNNGKKLRLNSFPTDHLRGFGLAQRTRDFSQFLDAEALYHRRPSQWVKPRSGDWGTGKVELFEIPSLQEFADNVVAYWIPEENILKGDQKTYSYQLTTFDSRHPSQTLGQVKRSVTGSIGLPNQSPNSTSQNRRFVIDFENVPTITVENGINVSPELHLTSGTFSELVLIKLPFENQWRATFEFYPDTEDPSTLSLFLSRDSSPVTETWSYLWEPETF
jgi:glucans biosynthesis protein